MYRVGQHSLPVGEFGAPLLSPNPGCSLSDRNFWTPSIHGDAIFLSSLLGWASVSMKGKEAMECSPLRRPKLSFQKRCSCYFIASSITMRKERTLEGRENEGGSAVREKKTSKTKEQRVYCF